MLESRTELTIIIFCRVTEGSTKSPLNTGHGKLSYYQSLLGACNAELHKIKVTYNVNQRTLAISIKSLATLLVA